VLSWQYPIVELLTGAIFAFVPMRIFLLDLSPSVDVTVMFLSSLWVLAFLILLLISVIDFRHYIIPDQLNLGLGMLGVISTGITFWLIRSSQLLIPGGQWSFLGHYALVWNFFDSIWWEHLFAAFVGALFFSAIILITRGRAMGWGDVKLIFPLGLLFGWPDIIMIMGLSFIVGTIFVLPLLFKHTKSMKDVVPFGPFIVIAASLTFFFGFEIVDWYFMLFNLR